MTARCGPECSPEGDISEPEALPRGSEEPWGNLPGREVSTSTSIAGVSSMMSLPSREELSSDVLPGSSVALPELRHLSWRAARRAIRVPRGANKAMATEFTTGQVV